VNLRRRDVFSSRGHACQEFEVDQIPPTILVVEDDDEVREAICGVLTDAGFGIETAATGLEAIGLIDEMAFDLVVVDIQLPGGLSGLQMARHVRSRHPELKCLFISGGNTPVVIDPRLDDFIGKPFRPSELIGVVWKVLHGNLPNPRLDIAR
jgi:two-component system, NtrC family, sensor kinase